VDEAEETAEEYLKEHTLVQAYDDLLIPALRHADSESEDGVLDPERQEFVHQAVRDMIEDLARRAAQRREEHRARVMPRAEAAPKEPPKKRGEKPGLRRGAEPLQLRVLCMPAHDDSDALAGAMLEAAAGDEDSAGAEAVGRVAVRALSAEDLGTDLAAILDEFGPDLVLISSVPPHAVHDCRLRAKQVRVKSPTPTTVRERLAAGLWGGADPKATTDGRAAIERMRSAGFETVVTSLGEALAYLKERMPKTQAGDGRTPSAVA
jgi:hypothetical protein